MKKLFILWAIAMLFAGNAQAEFKLPGILSGESKPAGGADVTKIVNDCALSLQHYNEAQALLGEAIVGKKRLATMTKGVGNVKAGDVSQDAVKLRLKSAESYDKILKDAIAKNQPLNSNQKLLAKGGALKYATALLEIGKITESLTSIDKSSLGIGDVGSVIFLANNVPSLVSGAVGGAGNLFKYLSANKVDIKAAQSMLSSMGK